MVLKEGEVESCISRTQLEMLVEASVGESCAELKSEEGKLQIQ